MEPRLYGSELSVIKITTTLRTNKAKSRERFVKRFAVGVATFLVATMASLANATEEKAQYWAFWDRSYNSTKVVNHSQWDQLLKKYVIANHPSGINRFRYADVTKDDRKKLDGYIKSMVSLDPRKYNKKEQKAYWINLYNAVVVQQVLEHYPVKQITEIDKGGAHGPWDETFIEVQGHELSLYDIEHRILRPLYKDHKVHFALADGSLGSPNLQPTAYTGRTLRPMLKQAGRDFINHPRGLQLEKGKMRCSSIFQECRSDFAKNSKAMLKLFAHYAEDRKALYLLGFQGEIEYSNDWALNAP